MDKVKKFSIFALDNVIKHKNMETLHNIYIGASQKMHQLQSESVDLVVTSPPYPMIEMWDDIFGKQNEDITINLETNPNMSFELMHGELDKVWKECFRVVKQGGFLCINIGDATRTINGVFKLYDNHSRIVRSCTDLGFVQLPNIIWRKPTNAPNKFMGSGMLPCGAYVTLEHEYILIFRKGDKRIFKSADEKSQRMENSYFWEERNLWFSDVWEVKGTAQKISKSSSRERSAAFPFEIPYRLINMFSLRGDLVLDPFLGLGTTMQAAILLGRNSCGYEIDSEFKILIENNITHMYYKGLIENRLNHHRKFVENRIEQGKHLKYYNSTLQTPVMTRQEEKMEFYLLNQILMDEKNGNIKCLYNTLNCEI